MMVESWLILSIGDKLGTIVTFVLLLAVVVFSIKMCVVCLNEKKRRLELDSSASEEKLNAVGGGGKA